MMPLFTSHLPHSQDVIQFVYWIKRQIFVEANSQAGTMPTLTSQEGIFITERLLQDDLDIENAYRQRLELGREFYLGVKQHLMAVLQVWDAILDEKDAFDSFGQMNWDRNFIDSFLICTDIIPARASIGSLGPSDLQIAPMALSPVHMAHLPLPTSGNVEGGGNDSWQPTHATDSLQSYDANMLALSESEIDDTTTDEEDGDEDEEYEEDGEDEEEDGEDGVDDDDEEGNEEDGGGFNIIRPPTPYFAPLSQGFDKYEPEDWYTPPDNLVEPPAWEELPTAGGTTPVIEIPQKRCLDNISTGVNESLDECSLCPKRLRR